MGTRSSRRGLSRRAFNRARRLWVALTGRRLYIVLIGASATAAEEMLESMKSELEGNELLAQDFPEVCIPVQRIEGIANRCKGQLYKGEQTHIQWGKKHFVLPTLEGSKASGVIVRAVGITGRIRGMKFTRPSGQSIRPDLVIVDDPQTEKSANSPPQCARRERTLTAAVLGLAGPTKKISAIMPCTVIRGGDLADVMLDRNKHPEWNGLRMKLVRAWPAGEAAEKLWEQYAELRGDSFRQHGDGRLATEFYKEHRAAMDAGSEVAWPERFNDDELSAIQHAVNLRLDDPAACGSTSC